MNKIVKALMLGTIAVSLSGCSFIDTIMSQIGYVTSSSSSASTSGSSSHSGSTGTTGGSSTTTGGSSSTGSTSTGSTSTGGSSSSSSTSTSGGGSTGSKHTIMVYMCGADLESESGLAVENLKEMISVSGIGGSSSNVNVVVETGGAKSWTSSFKDSSGSAISSSKLGRYHVEGKKLVRDSQLTNASMGLSTTLQSFIEYGVNNYPADRYGLIMWNHGGGMSGCCFDENYSDNPLTPQELATAVAGAKNKLSYSANFDWIGYDCCMMQVADIADYNSSYFNYMVTSQETEPGYGWDYDGFLADLVANPTQTTAELGKKICTTYATKIKQYYNDLASYSSQYSSYKNKSDHTLSVLDLSKVSAYMSAFNTMAGNLKSSITSKSKFNALLPSSIQQFGWYPDSDYDPTSGEYLYGLYDAKMFLNNVNSLYPSAGASAVLSALNNVIYYNDVGNVYTNRACGLSIYAYSVTSYTTYSYISSNLSNWKSLNQSYGGSCTVNVYYGIDA